MRNMSFSATLEQMHDGTKTVTRRQGWVFLRPGDRLWAVEKVMGLKKGEKIKRIGMIEVVSVRREPVSEVTAADVTREGFPDWEPQQFISLYCNMNRCRPCDDCTRIEFIHVDAGDLELYILAGDLELYILDAGWDPKEGE